MEDRSWIQHLIPDGPHCSHFGLSGNLNHTRQTKLSSFQQASSLSSSLEPRRSNGKQQPQLVLVFHFFLFMASAVALLLLQAGNLSRRRRRQPPRAPLSLAHAYLERQVRRNIWIWLVHICPNKDCTLQKFGLS